MNPGPAPSIQYPIKISNTIQAIDPHRNLDLLNHAIISNVAKHLAVILNRVSVSRNVDSVDLFTVIQKIQELFQIAINQSCIDINILVIRDLHAQVAKFPDIHHWFTA
jgi:acyl carrier protein